MRRLGLFTAGLMVAGMLGAGWARAQSNTDSFFSAAPIFQVLDYAAGHYRFKQMVLQPNTGYVLLVFEEFDPVTDRATGRIVIQRRTDTKLATCVEPSTGVVVECAPGALIR